MNKLETQQQKRMVRRTRIIADGLKYIADRVEKLPNEKPDARVRFWRQGRKHQELEKGFDARDFFEMFKK